MRWVEPPGPTTTSSAQSRRFCRHHCAYPRELASDPLAPDVIEVHGGVERLGRRLQPDIVAFALAQRPSDYGPRKHRSSKPSRRSKPNESAEAATMLEQQPQAAAAPPQTAEPALEPRLANVLERIRGGEDTLAKLCLGARDCDEPALALAELELIGLLQRSPDGRYLPSTGHLR
jgi:hypothetical protein